MLHYLQKKEDGPKEKASIEDSAFEALEKDFQDVSLSSVLYFVVKSF